MRGGLKNEPALKTRRVVLLWCTNFDRKGGVSVRHVATSKRCSSGQYTSLTQKGGVCMKHGAKIERKRCSSDGCTNVVVKGKEECVLDIG